MGETVMGLPKPPSALCAPTACGTSGPPKQTACTVPAIVLITYSFVHLRLKPSQIHHRKVDILGVRSGVMMTIVWSPPAGVNTGLQPMLADASKVFTRRGMKQQ